ncbi:MAG: hypothetical protein IJO32_00450 [Bacilli bacterium]|nr:hypothetical protein [Bacilli bacterium]
MKINSEELYKFINELGTNEKVRFKVYYDDNYVTEVLWNGDSFEWETGTFTSEAFFNPLYDFEEIKEEKEIEKIILNSDGDIVYYENGEKHRFTTNKQTKYLTHKINEIIDEINRLKKGNDDLSIR